MMGGRGERRLSCVPELWVSESTTWLGMAPTGQYSPLKPEPVQPLPVDGRWVYSYQWRIQARPKRYVAPKI